MNLSSFVEVSQKKKVPLLTDKKLYHISYALFILYSESSISVKNTNRYLDPKFQSLRTQVYIQTIDVWNDKYKQYPMWQTTLTHN